jgi:hypothetical protein
LERSFHLARISPQTDRNADVAKGQIAFSERVARPLYEALAARIPGTAFLLGHLSENLKLWELRANKK